MYLSIHWSTCCIICVFRVILEDHIWVFGVSTVVIEMPTFDTRSSPTLVLTCLVCAGRYFSCWNLILPTDIYFVNLPLYTDNHIVIDCWPPYLLFCLCCMCLHSLSHCRDLCMMARIAERISALDWLSLHCAAIITLCLSSPGLCPYARYFTTLASLVDRDVNVGPISWSWLRRWFQTLNLSFTFYIYKTCSCTVSVPQVWYRSLSSG